MNAHRNEQAFALHHRAGNAGVAVAVNTRPQKIQSKRRKNDRKAVRQKLKSRSWD